MPTLSAYWASFQLQLFPHLRGTLPPGVLERFEDFIITLDLIRVEATIPAASGLRGRPASDRRALARAFLAKAYFDFPTTEALWERLQVDEGLRRVCGWGIRKEVPSPSTFSRAFAHFAAIGLLDCLHAGFLHRWVGDTVIWHDARDSTHIVARERQKPKKDAPPSDPAPAAGTAEQAASQASTTAAERQEGTLAAPYGRRKRAKRRTAPAVPSRITRQYESAPEDLANLLAELPKAADFGRKLNSKGKQVLWYGYKFHVDVGDGGMPLAAVTTSASMHDSQAAIPLSRLTARSVSVFYEIMDSAYDAELIRKNAADLGRVAITEKNGRGHRKPAWEPDRERRFQHRTQSERFNADLKDNHGGRHVRVRGQPKVHAHLMFGLLVICAEALRGWCT